MIKNNKWKLLFSSIVILLPIIFGLIFWNELPKQMITHWGIDGNADGFSNRYFAVFALPIFILVIHWLCIFFTAVIDKKNENQNNKVFGLVIWITPIISLVSNGIIYAASFDKEFSPYLITSLLMGTVFIVIGNYLPKCRQNYTIGIKVKWTLESEENWNATHRFGGKVWVIGGLLIMISSFLPETTFIWVMVSAILILAIVPIIYSYLYYKKQLREGKSDIKPLPKTKANKIATIISLIVVTAILIFTGFIMFSGKINVEYGEESFTIKADYWSDITIKYDDIKRIEYRENDVVGIRTYGFSSATLLLGAFHNEEFNNYTRYSYTKCEASVVLNVNDKILVINGEDTESTKEIYEKIKSNVK